VLVCDTVSGLGGLAFFEGVVHGARSIIFLGLSLRVFWVGVGILRRSTFPYGLVCVESVYHLPPPALRGVFAWRTV
jgi:hypothetical protein